MEPTLRSGDRQSIVGFLRVSQVFTLQLLKLPTRLNFTINARKGVGHRAVEMVLLELTFVSHRAGSSSRVSRHSYIHLLFNR